MKTEKEKFGIVLPIILLSYFMILLDNSIIFTSTVKIAQDLQLTAQTLAWVSSAYTLTFGGFQLFGGRIGDIFGRKLIFICGLILFSLGSLMVGISTSASMMIAMRAFQGIGAAILAPTSLALLMDNYQGEMRTRGIAAYGATAGIGASLGLVLGGVIASRFSWRYGFLINVPVGALLLVLTMIFIQGKQEKQTGNLDFWGTFLSVIGLSALVYSINGTIYRFVALIVALVSLGMFILIEKRTSNPIMPLRLFADKQRSSAYLARFFFIGAAFAYFFLTPQALQQIYGFSPLLAGLAFLPVTIPQFFSATLVSRLALKVGTARLIILAMLLVIFSTVSTAVIGLDKGYWLAVAIPMIFFGIGQGLGLSPLTIEGVANTDADIAGAASGVVNTVHQFGQSVGMSVVVALTSKVLDPAKSYRMQLILMTIIAGLGLIAAISIKRSEDQRM